jgi:hypothetical protein
MEHTPASMTGESLRATIVARIEAPEDVAASVVVTEHVRGQAGAVSLR